MTTTILHIDSSARLTGSASRQLSQAIVEKLGSDRVIRRDLASPLPLLSEDWVNANFTPAEQRSAEQNETLALSGSLVEELKAADTVVIGLPLYNFSVPASFKAWIDLVARAGLTFEYTAEGPRGLLSGKRVIIAIASGGVPIGSDYDFASGFARQVLGFLGLTDVEIIAASGTATDADAALKAANAAIEALAA